MEPPPPGIVAFYVHGFQAMPTWMFFAFLFLFAGMIGSFLNVCIWRIPRGQSIVLPRSRCPDCGHALGFADLVPVLSWLAAGGKCRYCQTPIALRYQWVELTNITLWMISWALLGRSLSMIGVGVAASVVLGFWGTRSMIRRLASEAGAEAGAGGETGAAAGDPEVGAGSGEAGPPEPVEAVAEAGGESPAPRTGDSPARAGFTFLEVVVSVGILAVMVAPFMAVYQNVYQGTGKTREYIQAFNLCREKLEELRAVPVGLLVSDWEVYVAGGENIFADEFFGPYARMKKDEKMFYREFSDVWAEGKTLPGSLEAKFHARFKEYYGFTYQNYPREYQRFRRTTRVEDLTDPEHPNNLLKKVTVTVVIDSRATRGRPVSMMAYMTNR